MNKDKDLAAQNNNQISGETPVQLSGCSTVEVNDNTPVDKPNLGKAKAIVGFGQGPQPAYTAVID